jgi:hypothetical protein
MSISWTHISDWRNTPDCKYLAFYSIRTGVNNPIWLDLESDMIVQWTDDGSIHAEYRPFTFLLDWNGEL